MAEGRSASGIGRAGARWQGWAIMRTSRSQQCERMAANHTTTNDRLIWIDLEMTGLDTDSDSILEIATVVTDAQLNILAEGPELAIAHPLARLEAMDEWNRTQHRKSGPVAARAGSKVTHGAGRARTLEFLAQWVPAGKLADVRQLDLPGPPLPAPADAAAGEATSTTATSTSARSRNWRGAGRRRCSTACARTRSTPR